MSTPAPNINEKFPHKGLTHDGWSNEEEATATCFCGRVQMVVPLKAPGLVNTFLCNCADCRKVTASMFATNFTTLDTHTRYSRGEDNLTLFGQDETAVSGKTMTNAFCSTCGTLMWRQGSAFPGVKFLRVGTVDDIDLHGTVLKPEIEQFTDFRVSWLHDLEGAKQFKGMMETD
ncbi:uncharacterized protein IL334_002976 [Kwoniella shivajii]|uniref:CENP-V/GFA domain-containing protein n=1 Tax=Kwoniella shivajii TaxID=564305 RepID=A0ABZ1CW82_9TREE|nr:hypothetical protein IL334_002976 [Kwoniella shivajii]